MPLSDFGVHREQEIKEKPFENVNSIEIDENTFYFSFKGSDENGNYLWESISDPSFQIASYKQLLESEEFMELLESICNEKEIEYKVENVQDLKILIRNLYDETLGFNLPFTLLDINQFNRELLYHNAKEKNRTQS